jgi:rhamnopyranosyl-N-acetylglucosaminyl-diphospho-decaprenol beta-1,3/1,4-galactofuranosyltransferase
MNNVVAVIVTYNRLALLQEALAAVKAQTFSILKIIVVDNGSIDGTAGWLIDERGLEVIRLDVNSGASGGFSAGIKAAAAYTPDWIWVMDDDTICKPDALQVLVTKANQVDLPVGFIGSKCIWEDGSPHLMNVPNIKPTFNKTIPFNKYDGWNLLLTETSSWVSLLVSLKAVAQVGLPLKEFFFWSDDCEYTARIAKAGYLGIYCMDSIVTHKTSVNYSPDFCRDTVPNLWKHSYGFRNEFYIKKKEKGWLYFAFWLPAKVGYTSFKLVKVRRANHIKFLRTLVGSAWKSIFFNPQVEKIKIMADNAPSLFENSKSILSDG